MTTHIMLDLETWGKIPGSDLRSIGAVVFDPRAGTVDIPCDTCKGGTIRGNVNDGGDCSDCLNTRVERGGEFYVATDNPIIYGHPWSFPQGGSEIKPWKYTYNALKRDPETVVWWEQQSPEAQAAFANPVDLREALEQFGIWYLGFDQREDIRLWANDPHFDVSILAAAFRAVGLDEPWHYRSPRSQKTITEAAGMTRKDYDPFQVGTAHNALDDARTQAAIVCEAYRRLGLQAKS